MPDIADEEQEEDIDSWVIVSRPNLTFHLIG